MCESDDCHVHPLSDNSSAEAYVFSECVSTCMCDCTPVSYTITCVCNHTQAWASKEKPLA